MGEVFGGKWRVRSQKKESDIIHVKFSSQLKALGHSSIISLQTVSANKTVLTI